MRRLFSVITVNSTADSDARDSALTLREAINIVDGTDAYASLSTQEQAQIDLTQPLGTNDTIKFNIPGSGLQTIYPMTLLPAITKAVTVDGFSQPGTSQATSTAAPVFDIAIDGVYTSGNASGQTSPADYGSGLTVEAQNVTVDGMTIYRFNANSHGEESAGIYLTTGSGNDSVWGNDLGTDGTRSLGNDDGVDIDSGSSNNTIGGIDAAHRNLLSGNVDDGVAIEGSPFDAVRSNTNLVEGNYVGTDATGTTAIANDYGIVMGRVSENTIGGTTQGTGNLISGNTLDGIEAGYEAETSTIDGNYIGVTADGSTALGNGQDGVDIEFADQTTVGSRLGSGGNVISGNGSNGIELFDVGSGTITGNRIGTNLLGTGAIADKNDGIRVNNADNIAIGGTDPGDANVISGNGNDGVELTGSESIDNIVQGNLIGTNSVADDVIGNGQAGVDINDGSEGNMIGGTTASARNIITGNGQYGVEMIGSDDPDFATSGNVVEGNWIGVDYTGATGLGDGYAGVLLTEGASNNTIGGTAAGAGNVISGVSGVGVYIAGEHLFYSGGAGPQPLPTTGNVVEGNLIGTDSTGTKTVNSPRDPNANDDYFDGNGIYIDTGASGNTIGGTTPAARNIIAGNSVDGIQIGGASGNYVQGNYIGVDATGSKALGNGLAGIQIFHGGNNITGGVTTGAGNVISGNGTAGDPNDSAGIDILGGSQNVIQGNAIGTDAAGTAAIGNLGDGIALEFATYDNTVGGNLAAAQNIIAYNTGAGVDVTDKFRNSSSSGGASTGNTIRHNSIFGNIGLGIDLGNDGVTPNDPQDADTGGGNDLQNFPVLVTATSTGSSVTVAGTFNSLPSMNFTLDFYANATVDVHGNSQGKQYVGSVGVITDNNGNATFNSTFNVAIGSNQYITATATSESTSPYGDTSEFSQAIEATAQPVTPPPVTTTPVVTLTTPANGSSTNNSKPTFSGSAGTASGDSTTVTVKIYSGNSASGTLVQTLTTTESGGTYSVTLSTALPDGTYTAQASQSNTDGNTGTSGADTFTVDTVAPAVTLTAPVNGGSSSNTTPPFSGTAGNATGDSSTVTVRIYSGNTATGTAVETLTATRSGTAYSVSASPALAVGTYTAVASQSDVAGNTGTSSADTFAITSTAPAGPTPLPGTYSSNTTASYDGSTSDNYLAVFDGNTSTFFDAPSGNGNYVQIDLGSAKSITSIAYAPRPGGNGYEARMIGGVFEASNDPNFGSGVVTLYAVNSQPADGLTTQAVSPGGGYRYVRYVSPSNSYGNIAELQVFGSAAAAAPAPPGTPTLSNSTNSTATIAWTASPSSGITGYIVLRNGGQIGTTDANTFTFADNGLNASTSYSYTVEAVASGVDSAPSGTLAVTTPAASSGGSSGQLTGTASANTTASYDGKTSDNYTAAFDGNINTFFDAPTGNGNYVQLDLGSAKTIGSISYAPRAGYESRMSGGIFEVSNDATFSSGVVTLYTVNGQPADGLTTQNVSPGGTYRYLRYVAPAGSYGNIAEVQVSGPNSSGGTTGGTGTGTPLTPAATSANTNASYDGQTSDNYKAVFDGNTSTFFDAPTANGNYVQADLGSAATLTQIAFAPRAGFESRMTGGSFQGSNDPTFGSGVSTLYTITSQPADGLTAVAVTGTFRYVRYVSPNNSYGNIAEMQIFGTAGSGTPTSGKLTGTASANTTASYDGQTSDNYTAAFDGNTSTSFDAPTSSGNYLQLDLGATKTITSISYAPRAGYEYRMTGGIFEASNDPTFGSGVTVLYTITSNPPDGLTTQSIANGSGFRYIRYVAPNGSYGNIAEFNVFGS